MFAIIYVDVSRQVCAAAGTEEQRRVESALRDSGLLELTVDSLCAGGICGDRTPKDMRLAVTLDSQRKQQLQMYATAPLDEQRKACTKFTRMFEKLRGSAGSPPQQIYDRFLAVME